MAAERLIYYLLRKSDKLRKLIMKNTLRMILACAIPTLVSCYPARMCNQSYERQIYECRVIDSFIDDITGKSWRLTNVDGDCSVDGYLDDEYVTFTDLKCDWTVDFFFDSEGVKSREEFGSKWDESYADIKKMVGDYAWIERSKDIDNTPMPKASRSWRKSH